MYRGGARGYQKSYHGDNQFDGYGSSGYRGGYKGKGGGGRYPNSGRSGRGRGRTGTQIVDQHPGLTFLWNLQTGQSSAVVTCMAYDGGTLYVGLDNGIVKIYNYNTESGNTKEKFVKSEPSEAPFPNCNIKGMVVFEGQLFLAMSSKQKQNSKVVVANTLQAIEIPGEVESLELCTRDPSALGPSLWASTTGGTIAVIHIVPHVATPELPTGPSVMKPTAQVNLDFATHAPATSITALCEVMYTAAERSVLLSGDAKGCIGVWNIGQGTSLQSVPRPNTQPDNAPSDAISAFVEYRGTHFLSSSLDGTVNIWVFRPSPAMQDLVEVVPIAQYTPPCATGFAPLHASVLSISVTTGPSRPARPGQPQESVDWLVVSRIGADGLEVVKLDPSFEWGGTMARTTLCRTVLNFQGKSPHGEEHLVLAGSQHHLKVFRWNTS